MFPPLSPAYVAHLVAPHGLGDVPEPHAAGEFGSMIGGFGVRISLAYTADGAQGTRIAQARGRIFGSAGLIAPVSWLLETLEGRSYEQACAQDAPSILAALDGGGTAPLPRAVARGAEFAVKALRRALGIAVHGVPAGLDAGILVCRCIGVGDRPIRAAIGAGARTPEAIGEATGACTGCRSCRPDLLALLDEETRPPLPAPPPERHPVERICLATAGPVLRGLGLPLEDARIAGDAVGIRVGSPRPDACVSPRGAIAVTRQLLRDTVAEELQVVLLEEDA